MLISSLSDTVFKRKHKNKVQKVKHGLVCVLSAHGKPQTSLSTLAASKKCFHDRLVLCVFCLLFSEQFHFGLQRLLNLLRRKRGQIRGKDHLCAELIPKCKKTRKKKGQRDLLTMTVQDNGCSKETVWFFMKRAFLLYTCTLSHRNGCGSPSRQGWAASPPPPALLADRDHGAGR